MSTPVKHHTHGKVGRRRSHLAIKATNILACSECKAPILPHRVCGNCGTMHTRALREARGTGPKLTGTPKAKTQPVAEKAPDETPDQASEEEPAAEATE